MKTFLDKTTQVAPVVFLALNLFVLLGFSCKPHSSDTLSQIGDVTVVAEQVGVKLFFRGFVTDEADSLISQVYNFEREVIRKDTSGIATVYWFSQGKEEIPFYRDSVGTVFQKVTENLSLRTSAYGLLFRKPLILSRWKVMFKGSEGLGTEWNDAVDTLFTMYKPDGEKQLIRYHSFLKARNDGLLNTHIPYGNKVEQVIDVNWYEISTYILNTTSGDTLFSMLGSAHSYFLPGIGAVKYEADYTRRDFNSKSVFLKSTWELIRAVL